MKSSAYGLSSSLIIRGLKSSTYACQGKIPDWPGVPKGGCGCMSGRALGKPRYAGDRGGIEASAGYSAELCESKRAKCGANKHGR